jgi:phenylacetate-CoA ligase
MCLPAYQRGRTLRRPINTYFPTAETVLPEHLEVINTVLGGRTKNQYASSEGAPFILECHHGNLHLHPLTGVFEVLEDEPSASEVCGELVVTAFATRGTPLVRYRVGDRIRIDSGLSGCDCGSTFPIVASIEGRTNDVLDSPFTGQCNLGNLSNCTKGVAGISHFQAIQERLDAVEIRVVTDQSFDRAQEKRFLDALHLRLGAGMTIELIRVDEIAREKSGKLKMIKNRLREGSDWTGG